MILKKLYNINFLTLKIFKLIKQLYFLVSIDTLKKYSTIVFLGLESLAVQSIKLLTQSRLLSVLAEWMFI